MALVALRWRAWSPFVALGRPGRRASLRGRRCTWRHLLSFHVAGVALGDIYLRLAWQARRVLHLVAHLVAVGRPWSPGTPRQFVWQAWHLETSTCVSRGRRATWRHLLQFHVAGVALGDIYLRLAWQAWHLLHLVARLVALGRPWSPGAPHQFACSTLVALGRPWSPLVARGAAPVCVAGVALGDIYLHFTWQAWHLETFTCVSRGRHGTWRHLP